MGFKMQTVAPLGLVAADARNLAKSNAICRLSRTLTSFLDSRDSPDRSNLLMACFP
jgi:hypothetical protein